MLAIRMTLATALLFSVAHQVGADDAKGIEFFEAKVRPVLVQHCYQCHSAEAEKAGKLKAALRLDSRAGIRAGGESGPAVVPGDVDESLLISAIRHDQFEMPPKGKLPKSVIADLVQWVEMGAPDPRQGGVLAAKEEIDIEAGRKFWSFRPIHKPAVPAPTSDWPATDVDRFIITGLEHAKLQPVADASPVALVRRLYFDLTGLPPSPEELKTWTSRLSKGKGGRVDQQSLTALVDHLLASPRYGERWGRHWLDIARFAESNGATKNTIWPDAWRYRDYVIDAFNDDKPYDEFLTEQIAGDLLESQSDEQHWQRIVAAGFLAMGSKANDATRMEVIGEQLDVMSRAMLGLSIGCARCHDHKFDPVPTRDFYALAGIMQNTAILDGKPFASATPRVEKSRLQKVKSFERAVATASRSIVQANERLEEIAEQQNLSRLPGEAWEDTIARFTDNGRKEKARTTLQQLKQATADLEKLRQAGPPDVLQGVSVTDRAAKGNKWLNAQIHIRGSDSNLGQEVPRGVPEVLLTSSAEQPEIGAKESGRLQLAAVVSQHPLASRVIVNRIWHHLFGRGLVRTVDNFGTLGEPPTHPLLLEWLASKFIDDGRSIKKTIRRVVLSRAYQLSAVSGTDQRLVDPDNRLIWRHSPKRLDAEALRDAILAASGQLDVRRPDRFDNAIAVSQMTNPAVADATTIRAVYLPVARGHTVDVFDAFNFPPSDLVVGRRETPSVPAQALFMMNSRFVTRHAHYMARRLLAENLNDNGRIELAFLQAFGRAPSQEETASALSFINAFQQPVTVEDAPQTSGKQAAWAAFCQSLFASSEFRFLR